MCDQPRVLHNKLFLVIVAWLSAYIAQDANAGPQGEEERAPGKETGEMFMPGQIIESVDTATIRVMCQGAGRDTPSAVLRARQGCIDWFVRTQMVLSPDELKAYLGVRDKIFKDLNRYIEMAGAARKGSGKGLVARTRLDASRVKVHCIVDLYKKNLLECLTREGVGAAATSDKIKSLSIAVIPSKQFRNSKVRAQVQNIVSSYLIASGFKVLQVGKRKQSGDDAMVQAQAAGADIVVVFEAKKEEHKAHIDSVSYSFWVKAIEVSTATIMAAAISVSSPRPAFVSRSETLALQEATMDAMAKLGPQMLRRARF